MKKFKYGMLNGGVWMLMSTAQQVAEYLNPAFIEANREYIINSLMSGKVIAMNQAGGYHTGTLDDYDSVTDSDEVFPVLELEEAA